MSDLNQSLCALASADQRLSDGLNLLVETKEKYFDPDSFRMSLNNTIQTLRTVTFVLQKAKSSFPTFDEWYLTWQETMRADNLMKWLVAARNIIVKQGDLQTHSLARISILESWFDPPKFEMKVPPFTGTEDFARLLSQTAPKGIPWDVGLLRVERRWVHDELPEQEILGSLVHSFDVLNDLLFDAHNVLLDQKSREHCPWFGMVEAVAGRPPACMLAHEWDRTVWLNLHDGAVMTPVAVPANQSNEDLRRAAKRYPAVKSVKGAMSSASSFEQQASVMFDLAKNVLRTDGCHESIALLGYPDGRKMVHAIHMKDRTEKHLMVRHLAVEIEKTGADSLIFINEAWISRRRELPTSGYPADDPNREEALDLIAADSEGNVFAHTAIFVRDPEKGIQFKEEAITTGGEVNLIQPITDVWNRRRDKLEEGKGGHSTS